MGGDDENPTKKRDKLDMYLLMTRDPPTKDSMPTLIKELPDNPIYEVKMNDGDLIKFSRSLFSTKMIIENVSAIFNLPNKANIFYVETQDIASLEAHFKTLSHRRVSNEEIIQKFCNPTLFHPLYIDGLHYGWIKNGPYDCPCQILDVSYTKNKCIIRHKSKRTPDDKDVFGKIYASFDRQSFVEGYKKSRISGDSQIETVSTNKLKTWSAEITEEQLQFFDELPTVFRKGSVGPSEDEKPDQEPKPEPEPEPEPVIKEIEIETKIQNKNDTEIEIDPELFFEKWDEIPDTEAVRAMNVYEDYRDQGIGTVLERLLAGIKKNNNIFRAPKRLDISEKKLLELREKMQELLSEDEKLMVWGKRAEILIQRFKQENRELTEGLKAEHKRFKSRMRNIQKSHGKAIALMDDIDRKLNGEPPAAQEMGASEQQIEEPPSVEAERDLEKESEKERVRDITKERVIDLLKDRNNADEKSKKERRSIYEHVFQEGKPERKKHSRSKQILQRGQTPRVNYSDSGDSDDVMILPESPYEPKKTKRALTQLSSLPGGTKMHSTSESDVDINFGSSSETEDKDQKTPPPKSEEKIVEMPKPPFQQEASDVATKDKEDHVSVTKGEFGSFVVSTEKWFSRFEEKLMELGSRIDRLIEVKKRVEPGTLVRVNASPITGEVVGLVTNADQEGDVRVLTPSGKNVIAASMECEVLESERFSVDKHGKRILPPDIVFVEGIGANMVIAACYNGTAFLKYRDHSGYICKKCDECILKREY